MDEMAEPPVDWIPPQFRKFIYEEMTEDEIEAAMSTMFISEDGGPIRQITRDEFNSSGVRKVIGVIDTRYE